MADDFEVADVHWNIQQIHLFADQTGAATEPSTISGVYLQIWDGPPDDPGARGQNGIHPALGPESEQVEALVFVVEILPDARAVQVGGPSGCCISRGQFDRAIAYYQKARGRTDSPFYDKALFKIGWCHYAKGQLPEAEDAFAQGNPFVVVKTSHLPGKAVLETPGLVCGNPKQEIRKLAVSMTLTESQIELAGATGYDAIVCHHPVADAASSGGVPLRVRVFNLSREQDASVTLQLSCAPQYYQGPVSDHFDGTRFFNPGKPMDKGLLEVLKWYWTRQPQPWPTTFELGLARGVELGTLGLIELVEYQLLEFGCDPDAVVDHPDPHIDPRQVHLHPDAPAVGRVGDGVGDEVPENALQRQGVGLEFGQRRFGQHQRQNLMLGLGLGVQEVDDAAQQLLQQDRPRLAADQPLVDA